MSETISAAAQKELTLYGCWGGRTFPPIFEEKPAISHESVAVYRIGSVYEIEKNVVEEGLEGRNGGALCSEQAREGIGRSDAQG